MKYIRTEDGIMYVGDLVKDEFGNYCKAEIIETDMEVDSENIINEADNIQDLCDEFVFINKIGKFDKSYVIYYEMPNHIFTEPTIEEKIAYIKKHYYEVLNKIKGAIYTDKGLIYVAKMNDKGELELNDK